MKFPLISCRRHTGGGWLYSGPIAVESREFGITIRTPTYSALEGASITFGLETAHALRGFEGLVQQRRAQCATVLDFVTEVREILRQVCAAAGHGYAALHTAASSSSSSSSSFFRHLERELAQLGAVVISHVGDDLMRIVLEFKDAAHRTHSLDVALSPRFPVEAPVCKCDMPMPFEFRWGPQCNLGSMCASFSALIAKCQLLWDSLAAIDSATWVLEPSHPSYSCNFRRIALEDKCSVLVELDTERPGRRPQCRFLGPDRLVQQLRERYHAYAGRWDDGKPILTNLAAMLGIHVFPQQPTGTESESALECSICYAMYLGDGTSVPDKVCEEQRCGKSFHGDCLVQWLRSLASTRHSFDTLFGECPFCSKPISVKSLAS